MESIPSLTIDDVAHIDSILEKFLASSEAKLSVIVDKGGNVLSQMGDIEVIDVTIIAALAAGSFAATKELAKRIGEVEFNALYHQGNGSHILMTSVDEDTILITVFSGDTTIGLVRHYANDCARLLSDVLDKLRGRTDVSSPFSEADISPADVFDESNS